MGNDRAAEEGAALRFVCVGAEALDAAGADEISRRRNDTYATLDAAAAACADGGRIVVLDGDGAAANLAPYLPPAPVTAAGGLVVRHEGNGPLLLLIFRRGAWDLPKGKLDSGETVAACAVREVQEEVGIEQLSITADAGTTVHGYPEDGRYLVKTTHWYFMRTPERDFTPEEREGIEQVEWVPWDEARERLGYATLRDLLGAHPPPTI
jgi:8-oxo-dGTP pyrophosphatase MutT (NUDIX family)